MTVDKATGIDLYRVMRRVMKESARGH